VSNESIYGQGIVSGKVSGPAFFVESSSASLKGRQLSQSEISLELKRFMSAIERAIDELMRFAVLLDVEGRIDELQLVESHVELLKDPFGLQKLVLEGISEKKKSVEAALKWSLAHLKKKFRFVQDRLLSERFSDIEDVIQRVLEQLKPLSEKESSLVPKGAILVADQISFSQALLVSNSVAAFVAFHGSAFSHTAILARARSIPYVVQIDPRQIKQGHNPTLFVDGEAGLILVNPTATRLKKAFAVQKAVREQAFELKDDSLHIMANIEHPADIQAAKDEGIQEIGLLRTEYLFSHQATESEQVKALSQCNPTGFFRIIVRALDMSMEKFPHLYRGKRGLQFLLHDPAFLRVHFGAICKAFPQGCSILLPFVSDAEEFHRAQMIFKDVRAEFQAPFQLGAMIETPKAVLEIEEIVQLADFISIGSSDLIQYALGIDRATTRLSACGALHPGVLELIKVVLSVTQKMCKPCILCGELAADEAVVPIFVRLGLRNISIPPKRTKEVRALLKRIHDEINREKLLQLREKTREEQTLFVRARS